MTELIPGIEESVPVIDSMIPKWSMAVSSSTTKTFVGDIDPDGNDF